MIGVGIIGCGHWGRNYARVFGDMPECSPVRCYDAEPGRAQDVVHKHRMLEAAASLEELLSDKRIAAMIVATPARTHFELVKRALEHGKHVLAEKPLTLDWRQAEELNRLALAKKRVLMVAHTFLYNPAVIRMKEYVKDGTLGRIYYMHATRTHMGLIRQDVNAVWDLAPHDVSIFSFLLEEEPATVSAQGGCYLNDGKEDAAFITLTYPGGILGNIHVSWADSNKVREVQVIGSKARVVFDDLDNLESVKLYQKGISTDKPYDSFGEFQYVLRDGDIISPKIELKEPLKEQCLHFLDCIQTGKRPLTDGEAGVRVVRVMNAIEESIRKHGASVEIGPG